MSRLFKGCLLLLGAALAPLPLSGWAASGPDGTPVRTVVDTPTAPAAKGPYSQAIYYDNTLYNSGQIPADAKTGQWVNGDIELQTRVVMDNIKAILEPEGMTMANQGA